MTIERYITRAKADAETFLAEMGWRFQIMQDGKRVWVEHKFANIRHIGPVVITPAVYDRNDLLVTLAVMDTAHHFDVLLHPNLATEPEMVNDEPVTRDDGEGGTETVTREMTRREAFEAGKTEIANKTETVRSMTVATVAVKRVTGINTPEHRF